tara:strand:- start:13208 stop:13786 length:579 start_codon:yes stop_codon:yes gene_type:complete
MKKVLFITTLSAIFLTACTSSNIDTKNTAIKQIDLSSTYLTKKQIIKKFNLPPEPDPEINNSTIEGIDSNNNDIRDDWERLIAFEHYNNPTMMNINNLLAQNHTAINDTYESNDISKYQEVSTANLHLISCAVYYNGDSGRGSQKLRKIANNTFERYKYNIIRDQAISKEIGFTIHGFSQTQKEEICPKYAK